MVFKYASSGNNVIADVFICVSGTEQPYVRANIDLSWKTLVTRQGAEHAFGR